MSFRPVLGRSSAVASVADEVLVLRVDVHLDDRAAVLELDLADVADRARPTTRTVWPWPGVTACAVENSALSANGFSSMNGKRSRWLSRM